MTRSFDPHAAARRAAQVTSPLAAKNLVAKMVPGAVFTAKDSALSMPAERLEGAGPRSLHDGRRVIVVQAVPLNRATDPVTLLVVPCSASAGRVGRADVSIPAGEIGFTKDGVVAFTSLVQPLLKADLVHHHGNVSPETLHAIRQALTRLLALSDVPQFEVPAAPASDAVHNDQK